MKRFLDFWNDYKENLYLGIFAVTILIICMVIMFGISLMCPECICGTPLAVFWLIPMAAGPLAFIFLVRDMCKTLIEYFEK